MENSRRNVAKPFDIEEILLLEEQTKYNTQFKNKKSLSLSDLTIDHTQSLKKTRSEPTSLAELKNKDHFSTLMFLSLNKDTGINDHNDASVQYHSQISYSNYQIDSYWDVNKYPTTKNQPKSLSLSDLTNDSPRQSIKVRSKSMPPTVTQPCSLSFSAENERASPSILLNLARAGDRDSLVDYECETDCETDSENYGDMDDGRKRRHVARKDEWKKNKAKRQRMLGEEYLGYSNPKNDKMQQNRVRAARQIGMTCTSEYCKKSKFRGCSCFDEETRRSLHHYFWKKLNWEQRKIYVRGLVTCTSTARPKKVNKSRREGTYQYFLQTNDLTKIQVCKNMFLNTLSLKSTAVQAWAKSTEFAELADQDKIEDNKGQRAINNQHVQDFLASLPKMPSHYARKETRKLYLEPCYRTLTDVYKAYKEYCTSINRSSVSRFTFEKQFHNKNLSLYTLKKDMCDVCIAYTEGNFDKHAYQEHIIKKNRAREEKEEDKKKAAAGDFTLLTMDLEAVKVCPYLTASALYFKTKLVCHNFTMFNLITRQCTCYWFTETAADLTASTFASFVIDYLERHCLPKQKPIIIFSDGCTYQNRNAILANALLNFSAKHNIGITQKFLEPGHTQMECDSVHSAIERKLTNREIHLPSDYVSATKEARASSPYETIFVDHLFVKNYADASTWVYKSIRPGRKAGDPTVTDIRAILYDKELKVKLHFDQEWISLPQRNKRNYFEGTYPPLYTSLIPISTTKYRHLQDLKQVLPSDCHQFYDTLPHC